MIFISPHLHNLWLCVLICNLLFPFGFTASVVKLECNLCIDQDADLLPHSILLPCQSSLKFQVLWKVPLLMWLQQGKLPLNWNGTRFLLKISGAFSPITPLSTKRETMSYVRKISFDCWWMYLLLCVLIFFVVVACSCTGSMKLDQYLV